MPVPNLVRKPTHYSLDLVTGLTFSRLIPRARSPLFSSQSDSPSNNRPAPPSVRVLFHRLNPLLIYETETWTQEFQLLSPADSRISWVGRFVLPRRHVDRRSLPLHRHSHHRGPRSIRSSCHWSGVPRRELRAGERVVLRLLPDDGTDHRRVQRDGRDPLYRGRAKPDGLPPQSGYRRHLLTACLCVEFGTQRELVERHRKAGVRLPVQR